jgi:hypothetical protein
MEWERGWGWGWVGGEGGHWFEGKVPHQELHTRVCPEKPQAAECTAPRHGEKRRFGNFGSVPSFHSWAFGGQVAAFVSDPKLIIFSWSFFNNSPHRRCHVGLRI